MRRVLTVDDSESMRQMVSFTLTGAGYDVQEAVDGQDALIQAKTKHADIVLANLNMPRMDGISLVRELRKLPGYRFIPILVLTSESGAARKAEAKAAGATGWLTKPFEPARLLATLKKYCAEVGPAP